MKFRIGAAFAAVFVFVLSGCTSGEALPEAAGPETTELRVMSQNVYIGGNVVSLTEGVTPDELLDTVLQTDFEDRADQIARQVGAQEPDLIGLQEVVDITVTESGEETLRLDYLEILLTAFEAEGLDYEVAASVNNLEGTVPTGFTGSIQVVDRDVTLYRTSTTSVSNPLEVNYENSAAFGVAVFTLESLRGYTSVDATVNGETVQFINTHLEQQIRPCNGDEEGQPCQELQSQELADALADGDLPVVLVGDLNAEIDEPTYQTLEDVGFENTWDLAETEGSGATCCFGETLDDETDELSQRIDHILIRFPETNVTDVTADVIGDEVEDRTESGLWPADHAGPFAIIGLEPAAE